MPRLYDWQRSSTLRASLEVYDWERNLEQPSVGMQERADRHRSRARNWAAATGLIVGNCLSVGVGVGRAVASALFVASLALYNNERSVELQNEAEELWPEAWTTEAESVNIE